MGRKYMDLEGSFPPPIRAVHPHHLKSGTQSRVDTVLALRQRAWPSLKVKGARGGACCGSGGPPIDPDRPLPCGSTPRVETTRRLEPMPHIRPTTLCTLIHLRGPRPIARESDREGVHLASACTSPAPPWCTGIGVRVARKRRGSWRPRPMRWRSNELTLLPDAGAILLCRGGVGALLGQVELGQLSRVAGWMHMEGKGLSGPANLQALQGRTDPGQACHGRRVGCS